MWVVVCDVDVLVDDLVGDVAEFVAEFMDDPVSDIVGLAESILVELEESTLSLIVLLVVSHPINPTKSLNLNSCLNPSSS